MRLWLILTVGIALIAAYVTYSYVSKAQHERWLVEQGSEVKATVDSIIGMGARAHTSRDAALMAQVRYSVKDQTYTPEIEFPPEKGASLAVGDTVTLHLDPNNPNDVTARKTVRGWLASLTAPALLLPLAALLALITLWQRSRVINVWCHGQPVEATVVDWHKSGMAPRSVIMRYTLADSDDRRVFSTLWPHDAGELSAGQTVTMIMPPGKPSRAIAAELYAE